jgi:hypothetical protein
MPARSFCLWVLVGAVFFSPIAVGILPFVPYGFIAGMLFAFAAYASGRERSRRPKQLALVLLSLCFAVTTSDLIGRPLRFYLFEVRPADRFIYRWPPLPALQRYVAGAHFEGVTYGDLAATSGRSEWRENRQIRFVTDAYGFRNEAPGTDRETRPLDVIVLGDSFGVAAATTQENTLSSWLAREHDLTVYNLSISRENPRQEYANLVLETERLKTREGTLVLWLVFSGNDLDEPYPPELERPHPVWPGAFNGLTNRLSDFRARSPIRRLMLRRAPDQVVERRFVDGRRILFLRAYAQRRTRTLEDVKQHQNFDGLKATLGAMEQFAGERRLTVAVAFVPSKEEVYSWVLDGAPPWSADNEPSGLSVALRGLCKQHGFKFLDLKPTLVDASRRAYEQSGALLWWRDDSHWNDEGQRIAAAVIYENLVHEIQRP